MRNVALAIVFIVGFFLVYWVTGGDVPEAIGR